MINLYLSAPAVACYANDNDAYIPEIWAMESLQILNENTVMAQMVHRDFSNEVANFGDTVNTRKPANFKIKRKTGNESVATQDAQSPNVPVQLNMHLPISFVLYDGESSKSFKDLVEVYLKPAVQAAARGVDRSLLGQAYKFISTPTRRSGRLQNLSSATAHDYVIEAMSVLDKNLCPEDGRKLVVTPDSKAAILKTELFVSAEKRGDGGSALERAVMGTLSGFDIVMTQNASAPLLSGSETLGGTVDNALAAGSGGVQDITTDGNQIVNVGEFFVVEGNDQPTYVVAQTDNATDTSDVTLNEVNKFATGATAPFTRYVAADVDQAYAVGWAGDIIIDGHATDKNIQRGQLIAFGVGANRRTYTVIEATLTSSTSTTIVLDRPLEVALANNDLAFPGPAGSVNFAFHRNALALVTRPLALPRQGSGALSGLAAEGGVGIRVVMTYDGVAQGTRVTADLLYGVAVLDTALGAVLLG